MLLRMIYKVRDLRSRALFAALKKYCSGDVLDVGGGRFYLTAKAKKINFKSWTNLENDKSSRVDTKDKDYKFVLGDGCDMKFKNGSFDTVLNVQVLEHVFEPIKMVGEIARVLKPGGVAIFLVPQTSMLHLAPYHYYNFTRYWISAAMRESKLKIVKIEPIGGLFSSVASNLFYFFLQSFRVKGTTSAQNKRSVAFYILFPVMLVYVLASFPILMLLSLADLTEEPNNHLVVVKK